MGGFSFSTIKKQQDNNRAGFCVYKGSLDGELVYIGTTIQRPKDRFRWHKANGKNFDFEVLQYCENEVEMIDLEFELIKKHKPKYNKITKRKQNLNRKLTQEQLDARVGDKTWCQCCLRRRVNPGYSSCYNCSR